MAIYDHKYGELPYFRVFRAWGGKEYQEYVRIKRSRDAAYKKAQEIDERLAARQKAFYTRQAYTKEFHIRKDGRIRGVRRVCVKRKGRAPTDVLELRINIPWEDSVRRTTISIDVHGLEKAFKMAVEKVGEWYGLEKGSEVKRAMQDAYKIYAAEYTQSQDEDQEAPVKPVAEPTVKEAIKEETEQKEAAADTRNEVIEAATTAVKEELSMFKEGLLRAIKKFRE